MLNKYIIYERYEYWGKEGKTWTKWFRAILTPFYDTEKEALEKIKEMKESNKPITKATKLKYEFECRVEDIDTFPIPKPKYHKKGRPSKEEIAKKEAEMKNYWRDKCK